MKGTEDIKIIYIDDEEMLRENIGDYLEDSGFTVIKAEDGERGLELIEGIKPDVVLLDLHMPGISGIEVLSIVKAKYPEIAVIIVSGAGEISYAIKALQNGAWDFITKPVEDMQVIVYAIDRVMEKVELIKKNREYEENLERLVIEKSQALKESEIKYRGIYYNSGDAFMIMDTNGNFISGNPSIVKMFKCKDEDDFVSYNQLSLSQDFQADEIDSNEQFRIEINKTLENGSNFFEWKYKRVGGKSFYATVMLTKMDISDSTVLQATVRDITKQKQTEEELRQAQKMEILGTLAGGLAHDFNNMLSGVIGTVSLIRHKLNMDMEIKKENLEDYISMIEFSSESAANLVKQLLSLSRKQEFRFVNVDLNDILKQIIKICKTTVDKSINLIYENTKQPMLSRVDPTQIEQVMLNMCINSVHAMTTMREKGTKSGGTLHLSIKSIEIDEYFRKNHNEAVEDKYNVVSIKDTGVGMSKEIIEKIFTPFFTTKEKGVGTGLGLSMVYNIIKEHNGFLDVYSEPAKGTTFNIYLPQLNKDDASNYDLKKDNSVQKGIGTILVVDDEDIMRVIAKKILEACGYRVITVKNGQRGIDVLNEKKEKITAVLLDMSMPGLSGKETFLEMKKIDSNVKVLLTSGLKLDKRINEVMTLGVKDFIQKPLTLRDLSIAMKKVIGS